jgi:Xaa-Pro dipeptidase
MSLYHQHIQTLVERFNEACQQFQLTNIVLHSGSTTYYPGDDLSHPFHPNPMAQQWLPYDVPADTWIVFSIETGLTLYWPAKQDFWHVIPDEPTGAWTKDWSIIASVDLSWLSGLKGNTSVFTHQPQQLDHFNDININPVDLGHWLNFDRAYKTEWEIENIRIANQKAVRGHLAAKSAFEAGLSELAIHRAYLDASLQQQIEEPYGAIVALNESAAVLHYEQKQGSEPNQSNTLLIDAGAKNLGYASDITRTYSQPGTLFADMISAVETYQQALSDSCVTNKSYLDIHNDTLHYTAQLLRETDLCALSIEEQMVKRIPQVFFPHGIGHLLGLQVHDVGGHQADRAGNTTARPEHAPFLRLMRPLEQSMVITIEPGLYFIPMLIEKMQKETKNHGCDISLINTLKPYGGIRIEDNIVVKTEGPLNLTRASFAELG